MNSCQLARQQILGDVERKDPSILVMVQNRGVGDLDGAVDEATGDGRLLFCKGEDFFIRPIQRRREINRKVVTQSALGERATLSVGDLASRRGDE